MKERYIRNIEAISEEENAALFDKKVCIIGCGGLGGYITEILARIGVGNLIVVDGDVFEESNLNRQLYSKIDLLGKSKAEASYKRILEINPEVKAKYIYDFFDESNYSEIINDSDVVVDALDNIKTKKFLQKVCEELGKPFVHGAIAGWYGQVATVFPGDRTLDKIYKGKEEKGVEKILGNLPFTASYTASQQSAEVIKLLIKRGDLLRKKVLFMDLLNNESEIINL
ncbi:Molybdopterin-synthase adenylyltransferase [Sebaldella termitidis]|uniref:UBA/THIF-type NAD/FAD binding protein n=1 Tax=Sebaldella termitidis (strain ATCC 33386 / NCTC 11300) TaxID=526218 RepID=D1AIF3_SEBTE|nr:HesA/MoeB/ThiF family protein [Sebaldella termitidis]ACZ08537.1 UBA/THIF-type NAD/FAD binding protein [Sebaldella termitidis ATCC 33386]SUI23852.1 Molybdopterin-synthase adenylyltransferase [Sebaldella termitidis]HQP58925.1 HesA/MoeB/ThiF family protein [Petrotogaceae bacterium]